MSKSRESEHCNCAKCYFSYIVWTGSGLLLLVLITRILTALGGP